jgi:hypothetical protein
MDTSAMIWGVSTIGVILVWAIRQEGRLNVSDRRHQEHERRFDELMKQQQDWKMEVREHLDYIREHLDRALSRDRR